MHSAIESLRLPFVSRTVSALKWNLKEKCYLLLHSNLVVHFFMRCSSKVLPDCRTVPPDHVLIGTLSLGPIDFRRFCRRMMATDEDY